MKFIKIFSAILLLSVAILACGSPVVPQVNQTATPASHPASSLLPHSLYFLNTDNKGLNQVFRLDSDGKTLHQITFEPVMVNVYDVSLKDGSVAYVSNNQLLLVDANGAGRRVLVDGGPLDNKNRITNTVSAPVWSPDGSFAIVAYAPIQDVFDGGQAVLEYADGKPALVLSNYAIELKWGP